MVSAPKNGPAPAVLVGAGAFLLQLCSGHSRSDASADSPSLSADIRSDLDRSFDCLILRDTRQPAPWVLSGGTVRDPIATTGADFVNVSSGVESALGAKDVDKIAACLTACAR